MVKAMYKYSIPPSFNFLVRDEMDPMAMVFFEFEHHFTQDDLVKMWQGIMPSQGRKDAASGVQHAISEIDFGINLMSGIKDIWPDANYHDTTDIKKYRGWGLLQDRPGGSSSFPKNIQWMVFKVKQKAKGNYYSLTADTKDAFGKPTLNYTPAPLPWYMFSWLPFFELWISPLFKLLNTQQKMFEYYRHNWPYDFFSIVELAKIQESVIMEPNTAPPSGISADIIEILDGLSITQTLGFLPFYDSVSRTDPSTFTIPSNNPTGPTGPGTRAGETNINLPRTLMNTDYNSALQRFGASQFVLLQGQSLSTAQKTSLPANYTEKQMKFSSFTDKQNFEKGTQKK